MRYELHFRDFKIGDVIEDDTDFPNLWGRIAYNDSLKCPTSEEQTRLVRFIELNQDSIRLVDLESEQDVSHDLDAINKELEAFTDYIETDDWLLIADNGKRLPILCPILRHDGEIVWRWNTRHMDDE
ncbi:MAG: hypothetical protein H6822_36965 [Planctomycetaceae bacterium]|nr:hypothetical protein [Planctomycetaceae bacterium]